MFNHRTIISTFATTLQRLLVWGLILAAITTPLQYQRTIDRAGAKPFDLTSENRAAITLDSWQRAGRLKIVPANHPLLELRVPRPDWQALPPAARQALQHKLSGAFIRGTPVHEYVIRDDTGTALLHGQ